MRDHIIHRIYMRKIYKDQSFVMMLGNELKIIKFLVKN